MVELLGWGVDFCNAIGVVQIGIVGGQAGPCRGLGVAEIERDIVEV